MENDNVLLKNEELEIRISPCGAELTSVRDNEREYIHQKNPATWDGQAPLLFPVCGCMAEDKIVVNKKVYDIKPHGFAHESVFDIIKSSECEAEFFLSSNEKTKKMYPYDFALTVAYFLTGKTLEITYTVTNTGSGDMFFSIGSHEGYVCDKNLDGCELIFEKKEKQPYIFEDSNYQIEGFSTDDKKSVLKLSDELFKKSQTIVFERIESNVVVLIDKNKKVIATVDFTGFDNLFVWTRPHGGYICIEPWCGMAEHDELPADISQKEYIRSLAEKESFSVKHSITFGE